MRIFSVVFSDNEKSYIGCYHTIKVTISKKKNQEHHPECPCVPPVSDIIVTILVFYHQHCTAGKEGGGGSLVPVYYACMWPACACWSPIINRLGNKLD